MTRPSCASRRDAATAIAQRLGALVDDARDACEARTVGGVRPSLVARPADRSEVAATVAAVAAAGAALVPLGRGAHRGLGHPPTRYDVALVTERLGRVVDYVPADMTVTVEAGTTVGELAGVLAREGQWLIEPPVPSETTVGGLLAADRSGLLAGSQGRVRDFVIGLGVVTAAGVQARAGGRVVKNVAGYDLMKLVVGSLGTLAVVTDATFKVRPLPERQHGLVLGAREMTDALTLGAEIAAAGVLMVVAEGGLGGLAPKPAVVVRLGGVAADVAVQRDRIVAIATRHGAALALDAEEAAPAVAARFASLRDFPVSAAGDLVVRFAALPRRLADLARDAAATASSAAGTWQADTTRGILTFALTTASSDAAATLLGSLARVADAHGAHLVAERWPDALGPTVTVWHPLPAALPLMRRMKAALDPAGVLAPGRYVGRL